MTKADIIMEKIAKTTSKVFDLYEDQLYANKEDPSQKVMSKEEFTRRRIPEVKNNLKHPGAIGLSLAGRLAPLGAIAGGLASSVGGWRTGLAGAAVGAGALGLLGGARGYLTVRQAANEYKKNPKQLYKDTNDDYNFIRKDALG